MLPPDNNDPEVARFPPEYRHLEELVQQTENRLQQLDVELAQRHPVPQPTLQQSDGRALPPAPHRSRDAILNEKVDLKANTYKQVEKETADAPRALGNQVRDVALERIYKEDLAKLKAAERGLPSPDAGWGLESKQVALLKEMKDSRDRDRTAEERAQPKREVQKQAAVNKRDIERDR